MERASAGCSLTNEKKVSFSVAKLPLRRLQSLKSRDCLTLGCGNAERYFGKLYP